MTQFVVTNEEEGTVSVVDLPNVLNIDGLFDVLRMGAEAAVGPSNDAEHDALLAFLEFFDVRITTHDLDTGDEDDVVAVPVKLLKRLGQIDTDQLGAQIDSDDSHAREMYEDIDAINALLPYTEVETT